MVKVETIRERLATVRQLFPDWEIDALLITSQTNRRWLSGFTGSAGWLLVTLQEAYLATDFRYWGQVPGESPDYTLFKLKDGATVADLLPQTNAERIGVEGKHLVVNAFAKLKEIEGVTWIVLEETVESLRAVKTAEELQKIRAAAAITDHAMSQVPRIASLGQTEQELAWELEKRMREAGAEGLAFPTIVASGPNSAHAHYRTGQRTLQLGDVLIVDMGATFEGFCSDLTRSFFLGREADTRFWEVYNLVLEAQTRALDAIRPGVSGKEVDEAARSVIAEAGHGDHFGHALGHGVGLDIHEQPPHLASYNADDPLQLNMVTTVEPGVYLPEWGGIRIEDLVVVGSDGVEMISRCRKDPLLPI